MNNVILIGRLTRDPELRYTQGGTGVARFTLAVDRNLSRDKKQELEQRGEPTADFISIVAWSKTAELVGQYLAKGSKIAVQGRIQTGSYDGQDGIRRYTTEVIANQVEFLDSKSTGDNLDVGHLDDWQPTDNDDIPF